MAADTAALVVTPFRRDELDEGRLGRVRNHDTLRLARGTGGVYHVGNAGRRRLVQSGIIAPVALGQRIFGHYNLRLAVLLHELLTLFRVLGVYGNVCRAGFLYAYGTNNEVGAVRHTDAYELTCTDSLAGKIAGEGIAALLHLGIGIAHGIVHHGNVPRRL